MEKQIEKIIETLKKRHWTIGIMESCTGGAIADSITNIPGVSEVFKSSKVTYSDEAKIEAGVDRKVVDRYSVFSLEVAIEMAKKIEGDIGVGVTGNLPGKVFIAVKIGNKILAEKLVFKDELKDKVEDRKRMKREAVEKVWEMMSDNI